MKKIFSIVGARPQFIKLAPLSEGLSQKHEEIIVHTGQHYDYQMSEKIFEDLGIRKPDIHLETGSGSHAYQTGKMMMTLEDKMLEHRPDLVIIFGDTNSTIAGSLCAAKLHIPVIHVEAGLRSFNRNMPEEINRITSDHLSDYLFAPTQTAMDNLAEEGLKEKSFLTGDIMVDTLERNLPKALEISDIFNETGLTENSYSLLTLHRDYNVDNPGRLLNILKQLESLNEQIIFPVHPRTKKMLGGVDFSPRNIHLTDPLGYTDFIVLQNSANRIITDSGGIQKEAYILKKPCFTLRTETEWTETVDEGWNLLINPESKKIKDSIVSFNIPDRQEDVFGENVTKTMCDIIDKIV